MPTLTPEAILDVNRRYHDKAAEEYDSKWGVGFGPLWQDQVKRKFVKLLGEEVGPFRSGLEIGAGTGYFGLNLLQLGFLNELMCTDISAGMLSSLERNAAELDLTVSTTECEAEHLPFEDGTFDLVCGHAVLHHLPNPDAAFKEFCRVLEPGGIVLFSGEPSVYGDRFAAIPKTIAKPLAPIWRRVIGARKKSEDRDEKQDLEKLVDVHAFSAGQLAEYSNLAGFQAVDIRGEEFLSNWFGWLNRTLESSTDPEDIPHGWMKFAAGGYFFLREWDERLLERILPADIFYNILLLGRKPG